MSRKAHRSFVFLWKFPLSPKKISYFLLLGFMTLVSGGIISVITDAQMLGYTWSTPQPIVEFPSGWNPRFLHAISLSDQVVFFALSGEDEFLPSTLICINPAVETNSCLSLPLSDLGIIPLGCGLDVQYDSVQQRLHFFVTAHPSHFNGTFVLNLYHISVALPSFDALLNSSYYSLEQITNMGDLTYYLRIKSYDDGNYYNYPTAPSAKICENGEIWLTFEHILSGSWNSQNILLLHQQNGVWGAPQRIGSGQIPSLVVNRLNQPSIVYSRGSDSCLFGSLMEWTNSSLNSPVIILNSIKTEVSSLSVFEVPICETDNNTLVDSRPYLLYYNAYTLYCQYRKDSGAWSEVYPLVSPFPRLNNNQFFVYRNATTKELLLYYLSNSQILFITGDIQGFSSQFLLDRYILIQDFFVISGFNEFLTYLEPFLSYFLYFIFSFGFWFCIILWVVFEKAIFILIPYPLRMIDESAIKITKNKQSLPNVMCSRREKCAELVWARYNECGIPKLLTDLLPRDETPFSQSISDFLDDLT